MNLNKLMKQAQQMQAQMAKTQAELEEKTVEVTAAGGKVKVTANGAGEILSIKIEKEIVDSNDVECLEEVILSGVQQAIEQGKEIAQSEMKKSPGGRGLPGVSEANNLTAITRRTVSSISTTFARPVCVFRRRKLRECPGLTSSRRVDHNFPRAGRANARLTPS